MIKPSLIAMIFVFSVFPNMVMAMSGQELVEKCSKISAQASDTAPKQASISQIMDAGSCAGYIGGVISGVNLVGNMMMQKKIIKYNFICMPQKVHAQQLLEIAVDNIKKDPKLASSRAEVAIFDIFNSNFSCADKTKHK
ncbi:MAG: Rap1a/Tai family immunity protein [Gammaproteobacteria bacterium]|nr:Rap1a/Tai family immunity protein [Gammaproteobacteria bacterium]